MKSLLLMLITGLFLSSCSNYNTALDLDIGDCYIDLSQNKLSAGETEDLKYVEVVDCSEPHNFEIIAALPSVPISYRANENPIDEYCFDYLINYINSIFTNADNSSLANIYEEFDNKYMRFMNYNRNLNSDEPDLNQNFNCSVMSKNALIFNSFQENLENFN